MLIGEAVAGAGADSAHINIVLGDPEGSLGTAWANALAMPTAGHAPFLVTVRPGLAVRPFTLFIAKATVQPGDHARLTWGAAQAGVAAGVARAVAQGLVADPMAWLCLAAVWVAPDAADEQAVYANNAEATYRAVQAAVQGRPRLEDVLAESHHPWNAFFPGPTGSRPDDDDDSAT